MQNREVLNTNDPRFYNFLNSNFQSSLLGMHSFGKSESGITHWNLLLKLILLSTEEGGKQISFLPLRDRTEMKTVPRGKEIELFQPDPAQLCSGIRGTSAGFKTSGFVLGS